MDHLPLPFDTKPFIVAPYEAPKSDWYETDSEDGDFLSFPRRRKWSEEQLRGGDDTSKDDHLDRNGFKTKGSPYEVEQFFQTWLFFGLVIEFLKTGGVSVSTENFLQKKDPEAGVRARIVTTTHLPGLLVQWERGVRKRGERGMARTWESVNEMLERAGAVLDRFCTPLYGEEDSPLRLNQTKPRPWPVRDEISTTMIALAGTLRRAAIYVCQPSHLDTLTPWPATARSEILVRRLQGKWCIADVTTTLKQLPLDGHYYLAGSPGLEADELDHHAKCVRAHCLYDYDLNMYRTKHTTAPYHTASCRDEPEYGGQLGPERGQKDWADAINRILDKEDVIPLALWVKGLRKLWSVEYHCYGKRKPDYVAISHVWADGKGNPKANALPECQIDKIQRLVEQVTWKGRKEVPSNPNLSNGVGFWMDTLCLPVGNKDSKARDRKDKAIQSMRHVYSNAKAVLVLDDWLQTIRSDAPPLEIIARIYQSNWLKRLWTHQEGFLPSALWFQFRDRPVEIREVRSRLEEFQSSMTGVGLHLGFPNNANLRLVELYTFLNDGFKRIKQESDKWILYRPLAAAMSERQTSKLADETICLATIVDFDLKPFQKIPSKPDDEASAKERMGVFLETLGRFETGIIFNNYDRLDKRGYRWAPKSLLNLRTAELAYDNGESQHSAFEKVDGQLGLLVRYPGFLIRFANGRPSFAAVERGCAIQCQSTGSSVHGKWFVVEVPSNNQVEWVTRRTYAVILGEIPRRMGQRVSAVVALFQSSPSDEVYTVEHESIATVWMQESAPPWIETLEARLLGKHTEWLVV